MKRFFRNLPIKHKLIALTVGISGIALVLACVAFAIYEQAAFRQTMERDFAILADTFDDNVAAGLAFDDPEAIGKTLATLSANERIVAACVYNTNGVVIGAYSRRGAAGGDDFIFPPAQTTGQRWGAERLDTFQDIELAGEVIGVVYIGVDLSELRERIWRYVAIVGFLLAGCSLVALVLASRLQRIISQPIMDLARTVATVAAGKNYTVRAHKESDDELGRLVDGFNEMLAQIQARDSALQNSRDKLEERVQERTRELQQENAERKQAEEALRASQQITEGIINAIPVRVFWKDKNLAYVGCNAVFARDAGFADPKDIIGKDDCQMGWRAQAESYRADDRQVIASGSSKLFIEEPQTTPEGKTITILTSKIPLRNSAGEVSGILGTYVDITERKKAEEALRDSEERFSGAFEFAPIGVAMVSPDGRWLKVNRALCDLVGYSEAELLARTFQDISHPEDLENDLEHVRRLLAGEIRSYEMEKRYVHQRGHFVTVLLNVSLVREGRGRPRYMIAQIQDITARKRLEAQVAETHKELMESSRQAGMAEIATGVLHNVGNVLNSVNVSATLVSDQVRHTQAANIAKVAALFDEHKADLANFLTGDPRGRLLPAYLGTLAESLAAEQKALISELDHLRNNVGHIKEIVAVQQSYAGTSGVIESVSVPDLIEDALRINTGALARHAVEVRRVYQARPVVATDKHKVMQILVNLLRNAKYACDDSGRADKQITVGIAGDERSVKIVVSDNGIGIPAENLTRIFSHGFTTRKDGHGFGLHGGALAARELGGSLSAHSDGPGLGATFILELPLKPDPPAHDNSAR